MVMVDINRVVHRDIRLKGTEVKVKVTIINNNMEPMDNPIIMVQVRVLVRVVGIIEVSMGMGITIMVKDQEDQEEEVGIGGIQQLIHKTMCTHIVTNLINYASHTD